MRGCKEREWVLQSASWVAGVSLAICSCRWRQVHLLNWYEVFRAWEETFRETMQTKPHSGESAGREEVEGRANWRMEARSLASLLAGELGM